MAELDVKCCLSEDCCHSELLIITIVVAVGYFTFFGRRKSLLKHDINKKITITWDSSHTYLIIIKLQQYSYIIQLLIKLQQYSYITYLNSINNLYTNLSGVQYLQHLGRLDMAIPCLGLLTHNFQLTQLAEIEISLLFQ